MAQRPIQKKHEICKVKRHTVVNFVTLTPAQQWKGLNVVRPTAEDLTLSAMATSFQYFCFSLFAWPFRAASSLLCGLLRSSSTFVLVFRCPVLSAELHIPMRGEDKLRALRVVC
jgi:hypothetical protein